MLALLWSVFTISGVSSLASSQGISHDDDLPDSKYTKAQALKMEDIVFGTDVSGLLKTNECPIDLELVGHIYVYI